MKYDNLSPMPSLAFQTWDVNDQEFHVVVSRMTLEFNSDGRLVLARRQEALLQTDTYYGEANKSGVIQESDLAPFKPRCDVIVIGEAYAPAGKPASRFEAGIRISRNTIPIVDKSLMITGPRQWRKRYFRGWSLSQPTSIVSLPLRYEFAHGGSASQTVCLTNPIGCGYSDSTDLKRRRSRVMPAAQIESPKNPIRKFKTEYPVEGFGVMAKTWQPRLQRAGTFDDAWLKTRHPRLPRDFDMAYWNGAHPDLQVPWLRGDEQIELSQLTPEGSFVFDLPGHFVYALVYYKEGQILPTFARLDTLVIQPKKCISLVWRARIPINPDVHTVETRLVMNTQPEVQDNVRAFAEAIHG
jgi:hypothetical protein